MDRSLMAEVGHALYGDNWQSPLSRLIGVSDRTMRRWAAGDTAIPAAVRVDLMRICQERAMLLDDLTDRLKDPRER